MNRRNLITILSSILILIIVIVLIYYLFIRKTNTLTKLEEGIKHQVISASSLKNNTNTTNYAYSTWFYVDDWNYRFGEPKVLLSRKDRDGHSSPSIVLGSMENNITVTVSCYPNERTNETIEHECTIRNFPLQAWVNMIISLYGRTLDIYLDGKLVRTCVLPGIAKINTSSNIEVTPSGGFNGWTANIQYFNHAVNPQQAYDIYRDGFGQDFLSNMFNKYRLKFSFVENNIEKGSFEI